MVGQNQNWEQTEELRSPRRDPGLLPVMILQGPQVESLSVWGYLRVNGEFLGRLN